MIRGFVALAMAALAVVAVWFVMDRPVPAPDLRTGVMGLSYNPSGLFTDEEHEFIAEDRIAADLRQLATMTDRVRTYAVSRGLDRVPALAARLGLKVSLGIWLDYNRERNTQEIDEAIRLIRTYPRTIDRVFVGNEAVLRGDLTVEEINDYIRHVKLMTRGRVEVSTAEPWNVWAANPELAEEVDFIGAHMLPYWEGVSLDRSMDHIATKYGELSVQFPGKPIVIGEAGWPSEGRIRKGSVPSPANQAAFVRRFVEMAEAGGWDYYLIEAYDQPWKVAKEGAVGAYWGILNASGTEKVALQGDITALPNWPVLALASALALVVAGVGLLAAARRVSFAGQLFLAGLAGLIASAAVGIVHGAALEYATLATYAAFLIIVPLAALAIAVILSEAVEFAHALWRTGSARVRPPVPTRRPKVSVHVPCYNEPPQMVIATLNALARLDYPDFEVIVLDNNTKDPAVWRPVQDHCATLGPRFRFVHMDNVTGFKAGALNAAMAMTAPDAELIAVIDSDYEVSPDWLERTVGAFEDKAVALVQAPQDYRDGAESRFKDMLYQESRGFFRIGMAERDEANAIIQHGTMTIMRASALAGRQTWAEWCITEDSELGLRLFESGHKAVYLEESLGRGLMPDTLADFKAQRYRWAYGAMQIMKRHARALALGGTRLTLAQRYHFVAGWLPWIADALALVFVVAALVWTVLMSVAPKHFDLPMASLAAVAVGLFLAKTLKTLLLYPARVSPRLGDAVKAAVAGLALSHTVARAVITGLFTSNMPFLRTPKLADAAPVRQVLAVAAEEIVLLVLLLTAAAATAVGWGLDEPVAVVWIVMLLIQALPYACTLTMAVISLAPAPAAQPRPVLQPAAPAGEGPAIASGPLKV